VRNAVALERCGYNKEADDLDVGTGEIERAELDQLSEDGLKNGKIANTAAAITLVRESARSAMIDYRVGYRESFMEDDGLSAGSRL
jgi:hypothetical protein